MNVTIIGTGYVGLVTGACLAELGNNVFCLDLDRHKIAVLNDGGVPIYEPDLKELIARNRDAGRLRFSTDIAASVEHADIQFIAVGTPPDEDGSADLHYVTSAARNIAKYMTCFKVIVNKSTVPVGTALKVRAAIQAELEMRGASSDQPIYSVVSNPEFLKEGAAVDDFMRPDRIVIGCDDDIAGLRARDLLQKLYAPLNRNRERTLYMDVRSAEFTKYAANAMLATRISFMNEMANLADMVEVDIESVRLGIGSDPRIGYSFLYAGIGYGGSCFPKDVKALIRTAQELACPLSILQAVESVNNTQRHVLVKKIEQRFGKDLSGKIFAVWGLAFKPNTDDMREAPSRVLAIELIKRGASIQAYDPIAMEEADRAFALDFESRNADRARMHFAANQMDALLKADALVVMTEWKEFRSPDFEQIKRLLRQPVVFDGRNLYEPKALRAIGLEYHGIGRGFR